MKSMPEQGIFFRWVICITFIATLQGCDQPQKSAVAVESVATPIKAISVEKTVAQPFVYVVPSNENIVPYARARYNPFGKTVRAIPVSDIDPNWCKANEFERKLFPNELLNIDGEDVLGDGAFSITGQYDESRPYLALVGVFETCNKEKGFFVLVLDMEVTEKPKVIFLEQLKEPQGFVYLRKIEPDKFELWWCHRCGNYQELQWNKDKKKFVWNEIDWK